MTQDDRIEAIQTVVDRVAAYQDGAEESTVLTELREGFDEVGVEVSPDEVQKIADAIEAEEGDVDVASVIGEDA